MFRANTSAVVFKGISPFVVEMIRIRLINDLLEPMQSNSQLSYHATC